MNSMTGYGRGTASSETVELVVEISSVNRRNLEVQTSTPKEWFGLERLLAERVKKVAGRGKVYVQVKIQEYSGEGACDWDESRVRMGLEKLRKLVEEAQGRFEVNAQLVFQMADSLRENGQTQDWESCRDLILESMDKAMDQWTSMRRSEGEALKLDLSERRQRLCRMIVEIRDHATTTVEDYREKLLDRLRQAGLDLDLSDERVLKEIALFADRCDISEELTRLESHFEMLDEALDLKGPVGRKLDFICQEIYRELNTIGSKANNLDISRLVINCKNEWERLREQAANIE